MTDSWTTNKVSLFEECNCLYIVEATEDSGFAYLADQLRRKMPNTIWIHLHAMAAGDPVEQGRLLALAVEDAFGVPLIEIGHPYSNGVSIIARHLEQLSPFTIILSRAEFGNGLAHALMPLAVRGCRVILQFSHLPSYVEVPDLAVRYDHRHLMVSESEMDELLASYSDMLPQDSSVYYAVAEGRYLRLRRYLALETGGKPPEMPSPRSGGDPEDPAGSNAVLAALVHMKKWREALELAVTSNPLVVPGFIEYAGQTYFAAGEYPRLFELCSSLPIDIQAHPAVAYWRFAGAVACNRHYELLHEYEEYLESNIAPDVLAHVSISTPRADMLERTKLAFSQAKTPVTTRALGFSYLVSGNPEIGIRYLLSAFDLARSRGDVLLQVAAAAELAMGHQMAGQYCDALIWANRAMKIYSENGMKEELRRLFIVSEIVFPALLMGRADSVASLVETVDLDGLYGIPSLEGLVFTVADFYISRGEPTKGLELVRKSAGALPSQLLAFGSFGVIRTLIASGNFDEALAAVRAVDDAIGSNNLDSWHQLATGVALLHVGADDARGYLEAALRHFLDRLHAPAVAVASIHLARYWIQRGELKQARDVMHKGSVGLRELALQGWHLLGGVGPSVSEAWKLWCVDSPRLELKFMGSRNVRQDGNARDLPLRYCEVLTVLAQERSTTGDRLAAMMYPNGGNLSTLKSILSRLRKEVPIESKPYRIGVSWQADFVQFQVALREGNVREALKLYQGPLLPGSEAPYVIEMREHLEEVLRQAVLASDEVDILVALARKLGDDLELWEMVSQRLAPSDPLFALAKAHVKRIQRSWQA